MHSLTLLWLPVVALAIVAGVGAGPASILGARLPVDARAALALPLGAAMFACSSALLILDVPVKGAIAAVAGVSLLVALAARSRLLALARAAKIPLALAAVSLVVVSIPWIAMASWEPATYGNGDPYLWVSQANAYLDGPAPAPASTYPDREAFDLISAEHWPIALPFGVAAVAWLSGNGPAASYSAFAVLLAVVLALAAYLVGRAVLEWSQWKAAAAGLVVTANGYLLFATYWGWQAQIGLTAFAIASLTCFRLALDRPADRREQLLAGLFAAAAVATYGALMTSFIPLFGFVLAGFALHHRREVSSRALIRVVLGTAAATLLFGLIPVVWAAMSVGALGSGLAIGGNGLAHGIVPDALGLVPSPRILARPELASTLVATLVALAILGVLLRMLANGNVRLLGRRHDFLLSSSAYYVTVMLVLLLPGFNPYWSIKMGGYGAPLLALTAFAALTASRLGQRGAGHLVPFTRIAAASLFIAVSAVGIGQSLTLLEHSRVYAGLAGHLASAAPHARVVIDVRDPWRQAWAVYYLRDTPVSVPRPSEFLTGFGAVRKPALVGGATYRVAVDDRPGAIWHGGGLTLRAVAP